MPERYIFPEATGRATEPAARPACQPYFRTGFNKHKVLKGGLGKEESLEKPFPMRFINPASNFLGREAEGQHDEGDGHAEHDGGQRVDIRLHAEPHH